jgi:hypothetical protein
MSKKSQTNQYEAPQIEVLEVTIEKGFSASNDPYDDRVW